MLTTNSSLMDGINRHILTIAPQINNQEGCEVAVCTVFSRAELNVELESKGVKTYSLNATNGHDLTVFLHFYKVMKAFRPDIVHSHVMALFERIVLATCFRGLKYINTVHGIRDKVPQNTPYMRLETCLNKMFNIKYNAHCVVSNGVRQHLFAAKNEDNESNVHTVYNPLNFEKGIPKQYKLHKLLGVKKDTPLVGTACRFAAVKNPEVFTRVLCKVLQGNTLVHAAVMGDGDEPLKYRLRKIVAESNVESRFHWLGYRQDAPQLVQDLNCFVMTSISEGMPTSILESMASKTPFAMMEGEGGLKDIAEINQQEGPIGIICPKDDVEGMAREIDNLLANQSTQVALAEKAFAVGKKYFDVESVCCKLYTIYKSVCAQSFYI